MSRILYWGSGSPPCWRATSCLEYKGIAYESKLLEMSKKEHKGPEVMALNPRGQVPVFKDGDAVINDSAAILMYLEAQYPDPAKPLIPQDQVTKARILQRTFEFYDLVAKIVKFVGPKMSGNPNPNEEEDLNKLKEELAVWEGYAGKYKYIASDEISIADFMAAPYFFSMERNGATFKDHPNLKLYVETLKAVSAFEKTWPPHWKENPPTMDVMNVF